MILAYCSCWCAMCRATVLCCHDAKKPEKHCHWSTTRSDRLLDHCNWL